MIALDTNVVVRVVTADDPAQTETALAVMRSEALWVCKTVLLETEWVLRYTYKLSREVIFSVFRKLLGLPALQVEQRSVVLRALSLYEKGMDLADALHLVSSGEAELFATFDRELAIFASSEEGSDLPAVEWLGTRTPPTTAGRSRHA
ncbi:MAG: type II toxin-antitoxin system VapC family toxin [Thermoanaerobaculia bacterium]